MKKALIVLLALCAFAFAGYSQPKSFGLRLGDGLEITYQHDIYPGFLELDLGVAGHGLHPGFRASASYDFSLLRFNIGEGTFRMFLGPSLALGMYDTMKFTTGILAQFGVEYSFAGIPVELAVDTKPGFWISEGGTINFDVVGMIPMASLRWKF